MGTVNRRRLGGIGLALAAWLSATGAIGSCDFFKPAIPEKPKGAPFIGDYRSPTLTLQTLAKGVVEKNSVGQSVYMQAFGDSARDGRAYHAFFDLRDLLDRTSWDPATQDWDRGLEPGLYTRLVTYYTNALEMTWEPYEPAGNESGTPESDSLIHRKYRVVQVLASGARSPVAIGAADLYFVKSTTQADHWVIARWQDFHTVDADSNQWTLGRQRLETQ